MSYRRVDPDVAVTVKLDPHLVQKIRDYCHLNRVAFKEFCRGALSRMMDEALRQDPKLGPALDAIRRAKDEWARPDGPPSPPKPKRQREVA